MNGYLLIDLEENITSISEATSLAKIILMEKSSTHISERFAHTSLNHNITLIATTYNLEVKLLGTIANYISVVDSNGNPIDFRSLFIRVITPTPLPENNLLIYGIGAGGTASIGLTIFLIMKKAGAKIVSESDDIEP